MNKYKFFLQFHIYLSLFFLPVALLYAVSGLAYIFGANQDFMATKNSYKTNLVLQKGAEQEAVLQFLKEQNIKIPNDVNLKKDKKQGGLTMGTASYSINVKQAKDELVVTTTKRSFLGNIIMLHKDKTGWYFRILSISFGFSLMLFYLSGLMITFFANKKERKAQLLVIAAGILTSVVLGYISL